ARTIAKDDAPAILSKYVQTLVERKLREVSEKDHSTIEDQITVANQIIHTLDDAEAEDHIAGQGRELLAIAGEAYPGKKASELTRPETSLSSISLLTGGPEEPKLGSELQKEILSSSRVDLLVSFIRWSGIVTLLPAFREFTQKGGKLRVLTTTYMGNTEVRAVDALRELPNTEVRISFDGSAMRLHAKAYVFARDTGFDTAYVGSSNLTRPAITNGREWNMKVTAASQPEILAKIEATFENYWNSGDFEVYSEARREYLAQVLAKERGGEKEKKLNPGMIFEITPRPYQQAILDDLDADRRIRHQYRNLVVAATGTGKTIIAAFDYRNYVLSHPGKPNRLLYVAHREKILEQSLEKFRGILRDPNFGEIYSGNHQPTQYEYLFASIQTLNSRDLYQRVPGEYYDYIVVDEFHHAAADSYQELLNYFQPGILLGLTATPERADGIDVLHFFDGNISSELRLPEAIDRELLCPFQYFIITDTIDLSGVRWVRGGYDRAQLSDLYVTGSSAEKRVQNILDAIHRYISDLNTVRGLGFCVTTEHASYMAELFTRAGVPSAALYAKSSEKERAEVQHKLEQGKLKFIFSVDLFNEGVDIPSINTVLFLRPTESLTIFLQQLGRGLRLSPGKECLTVLDFVGEANRNFSFEERLSGLLRPAHVSAIKEAEMGFPDLPAGCTIYMEKIAEEHILNNIRQYFRTSKEILKRIASFEADTGKKLSLSSFIHYYNLDLRKIYLSKCWSRLCADAGVIPQLSDSFEEQFTKSMYDFIRIDSSEWILFLEHILPSLSIADYASMSEEEQLMFRMFYITMFDHPMTSIEDPEVRQNLITFDHSPVLKQELMEVLNLRLHDLKTVGVRPDLPYATPLRINCSYTRNQLFTALGYDAGQNVREGVKWLPDRKTDVLLVTLHKDAREFSPSTMYNDYSMSSDHFHWQSQATTSEDSPTGQRYIHHEEKGSCVLLFVRDYKHDSLRQNNGEAYTFLGTCRYESHTGSRPMTIIWKLDHPILARFLPKTSKVLS
ncbi:MAG: DUF3427 domain-containing protein, partial [Bulleidia sp.]